MGISAPAPAGSVVTASGEAGYTFSLTSVVAGGTTTTLAGTSTNLSAGTITLGTATNAGIASNSLSYINADAFDGTLNLGIIAQVDSGNDDNNQDGDTIDHYSSMANRGDAAFVFNSGDGITTMTLAATTGAGNAFTPTLNAGSEWVFDYTGCDDGSRLTLTSTAVLNAGGTLRLINVPLYIQGSVDLRSFGVDDPATTAWTEGLILEGNTTINVPAGNTLTLSVAQVDAIQAAGYDITGEGTVVVTGVSDDSVAGINTELRQSEDGDCRSLGHHSGGNRQR